MLHKKKCNRLRSSVQDAHTKTVESGHRKSRLKLSSGIWIETNRIQREEEHVDFPSSLTKHQKQYQPNLKLHTLVHAKNTEYNLNPQQLSVSSPLTKAPKKNQHRIHKYTKRPYIVDHGEERRRTQITTETTEMRHCGSSRFQLDVFIQLSRSLSPCILLHIQNAHLHGRFQH